MQRNYGDGMPVSYSPPGGPGMSKSRNCTTQSTGGSTALPSVDTYYIHSPTETGHQSQSHPLPTQYPSAINTSLPQYQYPQIHSAGSSSQSIWPTPPSTACEEDMENYSFHGSPASGPGGLHHTMPSMPSPRTWSPPEASQITSQQAYLNESNAMQGFNYRSCPPLQYEHQQQSQMTSPVYGNHIYPNPNIDVDTMAQQEAPHISSALTKPNPLVPSRDNSPVSKQGQGQRQDVALNSQEANEVSRQPRPVGNEEGKKTDEPYAQLIHRAFMSREPHAMTLQEIYQWFRENTEKAKDDDKGWQNSIRHNLSMNHAFVKRDRKPGPGDPLTESGEAKKASEWVLEDWAIHGVQSTTRYRSKGTSNRRGGLSSHGRAHTNLSGRANSGRKGGLCASKSKAAATKRAILNQRNHGSAFPSVSGNNMHHHVQHIVYNSHLGLQYSAPPNLRGEPITPPDPSPTDMMLSEPLQAPGLPTTDTGHSFSYPSAFPGYGQNNHHQGYHLGDTVYPLEDVTGIYPGHSTSAHAQTTPLIQSDLNAIFESSVHDPNESRNHHNLSFPYWPGQPTGGAYQP